MGYISAVFASKALDLACSDAEAPSALRASLIGELKLDPQSLELPEKPIEDSLFFDLLEAIAESCSVGRSIGLRIGSSMRCDDYGAFGLAFKSSIDLGGSFERVARYGKVVTNVANFTISRGASTTWMTVPAAHTGRLGEVMTTEIALSAATALSREVCGDSFTPTKVEFLHAEPKDSSAAETLFGCQVHFAGDRNGIEIRNSDLERTNALGDGGISAFFDRHLDTALANRKVDSSLANKVVKLITPSLSQGPPKVQDIASQLAMSNRTLQRRLAQEGCTYIELIDRAKQDLATHLLREAQYGIAEIAFLCGYSDQSTFTRAFRRWKGETPSQFQSSSKVIT